MESSVGYVGYQAKAPKRSRSAWKRAARGALEFVCRDVVYNTLLFPYGAWQYERLKRSATRSQSHTYTCFFRAPLQLQALCRPVLERLRPRGSATTVEPLRILVFACSSGAEAYTIASSLMKARPDLDFVIEASDLHEEMVQKGARGSYTRDEVLHSEYIGDDFVADTFDLVDGQYVVKQVIRKRVSFSTANLLSDEDIAQRFAQADIVFAQNVLFHLDPLAAERAFRNVAGRLKPRAALFVEGMDLDQKIAVTRSLRLEPLADQCRGIYEQSRAHISAAWWRHYYGSEPYCVLRRDRVRRYASIFFKGT